MNNPSVLICQGPYSFFLRDIGLLLEKEGRGVQALTFHPGDAYLMKGLCQLNWRSLMKQYGESGKAPVLETYYSARVEKIEKRALTQKEKEFFKAYFLAVRDYLQKENIRMLLLHNDTRWQHAYAIEAARQLNIPYFVFELGLFRPNTITMDSRGVNARNSVPREPSFYAQFQTKRVVHADQISSSISLKKRNAVIARFLLHYRLGKFLGLNAPENKVMRLKDYFRRFWKAYVKKDKRKEPAVWPERFLFVPFQVVNDSQTLLYSPYREMKTMAKDIINAVKTINKTKPETERLAVVFKEHPMDRGAVSYDDLRVQYSEDPEVIILSDGDLNELIAQSLGVVTLNSTVGLDAVKQGKRVLCIGEAFYAIDGIALRGSVSSLEEDIRKLCVFEPDKDLVTRFLHYLKDEYSMEGNEYQYDIVQLKTIVNRIREAIKETS